MERFIEFLVENRAFFICIGLFTYSLLFYLRLKDLTTKVKYSSNSITTYHLDFKPKYAWQAAAWPLHAVYCIAKTGAWMIHTLIAVFLLFAGCEYISSPKFKAIDKKLI